MDNNKEIGSSNSEIPQPPKFQVESEPYILSEACPYKVDLEWDKVNELLKAQGLDENSIKQLKIRFIEKPIKSPDGRSTGAIYSHNVITISTGTWWNFLTQQQARGVLITQIQDVFDRDFIHETAHFSREALLRANAAHSLKGAANFFKYQASLFSPVGIAQEESRVDGVVAEMQEPGEWKNLVVVSQREAPVPLRSEDD